MRVVVDMNVLISATIKPDSPLAQILVYIRNGRFDFLYFPEFLQNIQRYAPDLICGKSTTWTGMNSKRRFKSWQIAEY